MHACNDAWMSAIIQIRNVPKDVHRVLKARAAAAGMSLSEYLGQKLTEFARQLTFEEVLARIRARGPCQVAEPSAVALRKEREARDSRRW
jgi:hypothetical protein